jgi:hypothetical protein
MMPAIYGNSYRIVQSPGQVAIQYEMIHETRIIPLDGRPPTPSAMKTWLGSSRGHWEGQTLVVETTNFNGESPMVIVGPSNAPVPTSPALHIVERFTPTGPDTIQYEALVEDPVVLTAPFTLSYPWTRNENYISFEYACHEGNTAITAYIRATNPAFAAIARRPSRRASAAKRHPDGIWRVPFCHHERCTDRTAGLQSGLCQLRGLASALRGASESGEGKVPSPV